MVLVALGACAADLAEPGSGSLVDFDLSVPDIVVQENEWRAAPDSCEDICFDEGFEIAYAENAPDLAVVMRDDEPVCVETWDAIHLRIKRVFGDPSPDPMRPMPFFETLPD